MQAAYELQFGPGNYIPPISIPYWSFRVMVGSGFLMLFLLALGLLWIMRNKNPFQKKWTRILPYAIALPYLANSAGWILTEVGRQPWVVFGYLKTVNAVSKNVSQGMVITSLIGFTLLYGVLMGADIFLLNKFAKAGVANAAEVPEKLSYWESEQ